MVDSISNESKCPVTRQTRKEFTIMAKPHRKLKKANHGKRPASAKARKSKRHLVKT